MARDPRLRPFRIALWAVYLTVVAVALTLTIRSVVKNLRGPPRPSAALPTRAAVRVCVTELEGLNREQNERAWRLGTELAGGPEALQRWQAWSREWEQRLDDLADRCRLDVGDRDPGAFAGRRELAGARDAVLRLHRGYTVHINRFAQEQASLARGAADALREAQAAVANAAERR
jgi:hypothetical protein